MLCKIMQYYATPKLHQVQIKWRGAAPHQRFPLLVRCAGCDDATETSSTSKARARPTGCNEDLLDGIPYVNSMSVTAHRMEHEHTEKPTETGLATRPSRRRGGPATACQSVSDTQQQTCNVAQHLPCLTSTTWDPLARRSCHQTYWPVSARILHVRMISQRMYLVDHAYLTTGDVNCWSHN